MKEQKYTVCMLSCQHNLWDDRIYWKEAVSLQKAGYTVVHIGVANAKNDIISAEGVRLIQLTRKRYFKSGFIDKLFRVLSMRRDITLDIFEIAKEINADVYHFHDLQINKIGSRLKKLPQKPKVIYDLLESHGDLIRDHSSFLMKPLSYLYGFYIDRWELKQARSYDAFVTTEHYVWKKFSDKFPNKICQIIYNYSYFQPDLVKVRSTPKIYDAIYSGTISKLRGLYEIAEATRLIKQSKPSVKIIVIGYFSDDNLKKDIRSVIERNDLTDNLILHEAVPFEEIGNFYASSKIGLCIFHPVKLYKNAVFIKTFEYMAFGLAVVGSNFGNLAMHIETANAGITVDPLQPIAIAEAILAILDSQDLYEKYGTNGMKAVSLQYNWAQEEIKLLALYRAVLALPVS